MLGSLGRLLATAATYFLVTQISRRGIVKSYRVRRMLGGLVLVAVSAMLGIMSCALLIASLFFQLAELSQYVAPLLITGLLSLGVGVVVFAQGVRLVKP